MRSRLRPPAQKATSTKTASPIQSQSSPLMPPGAQITHIIVVHGAMMMPRMARARS